ncbi:MAG: hypothetical protein IH987_07920 [Planctomycetes bacterium]|nr:hypothetical protein [Planctomycetota bacterium]
MNPKEDKPSPPKRELLDGRGERPVDPNELAKWIVDQTTAEETDKDCDSECPKP